MDQQPAKRVCREWRMTDRHILASVTNQQAAKAFGVTPGAISHAKRALGVQVRIYKRWTDDELREALRLAAMGTWMWRDIAKRLGVPGRHRALRQAAKQRAAALGFAR